jgi:hypothetical protein
VLVSILLTRLDTTIEWEELTSSDYIGYDDRYLFWKRTGTTLTTYTANDDVVLDGFLSMNKIADATGPGDYSLSRALEFKTSTWDGSATDESIYLQGLPSDFFTEAEPGLGFNFSANLRFILSVDGMQYVPDVLGGDSYTFGALATGSGAGCDVTIKGGDAPTSGNEDGGDIILEPGDGVGTGANGIVNANGTFKATSYQSSDGSVGATGSFTTTDGKTVTVKDGLITNIV